MAQDKEVSSSVRQLRVVVEAEDYDAALAFYRDALGLTVSEAYDGDGGARVTILDAGRATLELSNPAQVRMIDAVEAEGQRSARIRLAFEVGDSATATDGLVAAGAELIAAARETPWRSLNSRLNGPAGLQLTLFQELDVGAVGLAGPGGSVLDGWMAGYEKAWASNAPDDIGALFAEDAVYLPKPYATPIVGRAAIIDWWLGVADEPGSYEFSWERVAEDRANGDGSTGGGSTGVVRAVTRYADGETYHNVWIIEFAADGRARVFTEFWVLEE